MDNNEDILWKADVRETKEELTARGLKFMNWYGFVVGVNHLLLTSNLEKLVC